MRDIEVFGRNRLLPVSAAFHQFPAMEVATNDATVLGPFYLSVVYGTMVAVTSTSISPPETQPLPAAMGAMSRSTKPS